VDTRSANGLSDVQGHTPQKSASRNNQRADQHSGGEIRDRPVAEALEKSVEVAGVLNVISVARLVGNELVNYEDST
jgi:hypothetical protein